MIIDNKTKKFMKETYERILNEYGNDPIHKKAVKNARQISKRWGIDFSSIYPELGRK